MVGEYFHVYWINIYGLLKGVGPPTWVIGMGPATPLCEQKEVLSYYRRAWTSRDLGMVLEWRNAVKCDALNDGSLCTADALKLI
jgi:hypothetical protein